MRLTPIPRNVTVTERKIDLWKHSSLVLNVVLSVSLTAILLNPIEKVECSFTELKSSQWVTRIGSGEVRRYVDWDGTTHYIQKLLSNLVRSIS
jgi:hypothetical protein